MTDSNNDTRTERHHPATSQEPAGPTVITGQSPADSAVDELDADPVLPSTPTTPLGLVGLSDLAPHLTAAGFTIISDPDLKIAAQRLQTAVRIWAEEAETDTLLPVLLLNSPRLTGLIPRIQRHVDLTVLGTDTAPVAEAEGYRGYQLPGTVRDILKNAGVDGYEAVDDRLELQPNGQLLDPDRDWDDWEPGPHSEPGADSEPDPADVDAAAADLGDVLFGVSRSQSRPSARSERVGLGDVVLVLSGSGGVGKSTFSLALAARAAERGQRVVLVDANLGQGDLATYLRVAGRGLPSMFDAVVAGRHLEAGIVTPTQLVETRAAGLRKPGFALLQAPTAEQIRTGLITPAAVHDLVEDARRIADLVVVDTQIVETDDPRRMVADLILPQLGRGGWAVAIAGPSIAGLANLNRLLIDLETEGINTSKVLSMLSRLPAGADIDHDRLIQTLRRHSVHLGTGWVDDRLQTALNQGDTLADQPALANLVDTLLNKVFDLSVVAAAYQPDPSTAARPTRRPRWLARKRSA